MSDPQETTGRLRDGKVIFPLLTYTALGLAQRGAWLIMLPVYLLMLSPDEFGVLVLLIFTASIFATPANLKLDAAMRTFYFDFADDDDALSGYLRQVMTASVVFALLTYLVMLLLGAPILASVFEHDEIRFFPAGAVAVATACCNACLAPYFVYLRNGLRLRQLAALQLTLAAGSVLLQLALILGLGLGLLGAVLGALVPATLILLYVLVGQTGFRPLELSREALGPSLKYSAPLIVFGLFYVLEARLDAIVLEHHLDMDVLGAYAMLISILGLLTFVLNALDSAIRPYLYPALQRNDQHTPAEVSRYQRLYVAVGLAVLSFAVLLGCNLGLLTDDPTYLSIRQWVVLGAAAFLPEIVTRFYALFYDFNKRSIEVTYWIVIRTLLMLVLLLLVVPSFGIAGALFAIFVSRLANAIVFSTSARRKFPVPVAIRSTLLHAGLFLIVALGLYYQIGRDSVALYGGLQFAVFLGSLAAINWQSIRK